MMPTKKTTAVAAISAAVGAAAAGTTSYMTNARGGSVVAYVAAFDKLKAEGKHVVVKGDCASSCTMALGYSNMCFDKDAVLRFHPAYTPIAFGLLSYVYNSEATQLMLAHYPPDARAVIDAHGDLTKDPGGWRYPKLFAIPATAFPRHLC